MSEDFPLSGKVPPDESIEFGPQYPESRKTSPEPGSRSEENFRSDVAVNRRRPERRMDYAFAPVPRWVFTYMREGRLSAEDVLLLSTLFHLARNRDLQRRAETPRVGLDVLFHYVDPRHFRGNAERKRAREALRKRIARAQERGLFTYRLEGNPTRGYFYVFTLPHEPPPLSARCPPADDASCPADDALDRGSEPETDEEPRRIASGVERKPMTQGRPEGHRSRPEAVDAPTPLHNGNNIADADGLRPAARDVSDENLAMRGASEGQASPSRLNARREATSEWIATFPARNEHEFLRSFVETFDAVLVDEEPAA